MKHLLFIAFFLCIAKINAQTVFQKTIGLAKNENGFCVRTTTDGGYIISGIVNVDSVNTDIFVVKTNANGDTLWSKTYGGPQGEYQGIIQQTTDGGYVISGSTNSYGAGQGDIFLIKTNANGDTLFTKTYGGTGDEIGQYIQQTADGGYIIGGHTDTFGPRGDFYLIKTTANGDTVWTRNYGGPKHDHGFCVQQTTDGGYIQVGHSVSFGTLGGFYMVKTKANGDTIFTRGYGGALDSYCYFVQQTTDGGYILTGSTASFGVDSTDGLVIKTNANGDTLWSRTYGGMGNDYFNTVKQTPDGGYILLGTTSSFGAGGNDIYAVKINSVGDTVWSKTYGGPLDDEGNFGSLTPDSGYVIAGSIKSFGNGNYDYCIIKTDKQGNTNCPGNKVHTKITKPDSLMFNVPTLIGIPPTHVGAAPFKLGTNQNGSTNFCNIGGITTYNTQNSTFQIYPNPAQNIFTVEIVNNDKQTLIIFDVNGKQVLSQTINGTTTINASNLSAGVYNVSLVNLQGTTNKHLVIVK